MLESKATLLATPRCCGSIRDISEWEAASDWTHTDEMHLWIEHPQLMVSSIDDRYLQITETYEYNRPEEPDLFTVDRDELKAAIVEAKKQLENFKQVLSIAVIKVCPHLAEMAVEVAEQLIYG